jgi:hypothetical protein
VRRIYLGTHSLRNLSDPAVAPDPRLLQAQRTTNLLGGSGLSNSHGDTKDGVGSKNSLVLGFVKSDEEFINCLLVLDIDVRGDQFGGNFVVDVRNGLGDSLSEPLVSTVTELNGLMLSWKL